jgi:hypothetical protein
MNTRLIVLAVAVISVCIFIGGIALGNRIYGCKQFNLKEEYEHQKKLFEAEQKAAMWEDSAAYYKAKVDTVYINRTKIKTVKEYATTLHNASLDTINSILMQEPSN